MLIELCPTSAVMEGQGLQVAAGDLVVAVFKIGDRYYVIDDACTHGPGRLSEGEVDGDVIECNFHNGAFNIRTGEIVAPPCMIPIRTYYTEVRAGRVWIDPDRPAEP
jgi:nitrite reductase/ring-hydroxylating ferredoxin subunit